MMNIIGVIPKSVLRFLLLALPLLLISCSTPSNNTFSMNKKFDRYQTLVLYINKTVTENPKYQTKDGAKDVRALQHLMSVIDNAVKDNQVTSQQATDILSQVFNQFEKGDYNYKTAKKLNSGYKNQLYNLNNQPQVPKIPWIPEEKPLK